MNYNINNESVIGVWGNEPYAIQYRNPTSQKVEVRLSIDGTDILTGERATSEPTGERWVVQPYETMELEAWPESKMSGARFLFSSGGQSVATHTHGDTSSMGYIAATVFTEGYVSPPRFTKSYDYGFDTPQTYGSGFKGGGVMRGGGVRGQSLEAMSMDSERSVGTGAGEQVIQHIGSAAGLRQPKLSNIVRVKYVWYDDLVAALCANGIEPNTSKGFKGINLGSTPRPAPMHSMYARFA